ncbi:hypothetical protein GE061_013811 [Apolygus lucorum]|uniref:Uncharacterized protein n=1 Tax=Apolygus lucorum TaxID=248454 RepID=A0A6A4K9D2_APOLU|nr:hypothetical protein GE061_013811 [Apolygus lucorum]
MPANAIATTAAEAHRGSPTASGQAPSITVTESKTDLQQQDVKNKKPSDSPLCAKILPDPQIVAKDIRDQLKGAEFSIALKSRISSTMKEVETLLKCYRDAGPYLRRPLVELRKTVKQRVKNDDEKVADELRKFQLRFERVKAKKHQIIEAREVKKVEADNQVRMFQVYICDNIRICSMDKMTDVQAVMSDAKKFKRLIKEIEKLTAVHSFSTKVKYDIRRSLQMLENMLALDGIHALRMRHETQVLKNAVVKGKTAEEEIEKRIKAIKPKLTKITKECETKRDEAEKSMREVRWKVMSQMDKEINDIMNNLREKTRYADGGAARQLGEFWVPPPITEIFVGREYYEEVGENLRDPLIRKPKFLYREAGKGRGDDTERIILE